MSLVPPMKNPSHRKLFINRNGHEFPCNDKVLPIPNPASTFVPPPSSNTTLPNPTTYPPFNNGVHTRTPSYSLDSLLSFTIGVGLSIGILLALLHYLRRRDTSSTRRTNPTRILAAQETHEENHQVGIPNPIWFINTTGLRRSQINSVPVFSYCKDEGVIEGTECSVCLGEFEEGERLRLLPKCNHAFHVACIDTWFKSHKNCPLCRAAISVSSIAGDADRLTDRNPVDGDQESGGNRPDNVTHQGCEDSSSRASPEIFSIVPVHASADNQAQIEELTNHVKPKNNGDRGPSV